MKEEFLHYLWKHQLFDADNLTDTNGNKITVIQPGEYNRDSGPDFFNARISVDGITWAGNIEVHTRSSNFNIHGHQNDPSYSNIILHVVAENDKLVYNSRGEPLPTAVITFDPGYYEKYLDLVNNHRVIACQDEIGSVDRVLINQWLGALVAGRLQDKAGHIVELLKETGNDWDETFYRILTRYFGFRVNTEPFEMLARAIPFKIIRKHSDDRLRIEALLFGTAGLLSEGLFRDAINDEYYKELVREYKILRSKYGLVPVHGWIWKFSRLRPANFPTLRISQLAAMLSVSGGLFSKIIEAGDINSVLVLLEADASLYWKNHYIFGKLRMNPCTSTGTQAGNLLLINAVIPVMFVYGRERGRPEICERAIGFLEEAEAEQNSIIREWKSVGIGVRNAFHSQALIELRNCYCRKRRCLECRIGNKLISSGKSISEYTGLILEPR